MNQEIKSENKVENTLPQEKVDANTPQPNVDPNLPAATQEESKEDPNWKVVRERLKNEKHNREIAERKAAEKEAEAQALKAAMEAAFSKMPQSNSQPNNYEFNEENEEQRINRLVQEQVSRLEQNLEKKFAEKEHQNYPNKLNQIYSDFYQTISEENLAYLDYHYPEVSSPLKRLGDDFEKWNDIYKAVKKFVPNAKEAKKDASRADANMMKPKSMSSTGLSQSGESPGSVRLTKERKEANWQRMQKSRNTVG